jgi:hypothetical protein
MIPKSSWNNLSETACSRGGILPFSVWGAHINVRYACSACRSFEKVCVVGNKRWGRGVNGGKGWGRCGGRCKMEGGAVVGGSGGIRSSGEGCWDGGGDGEYGEIKGL